MVWLETRYEAPSLKNIDGIIVLGGTFASYRTDRTGQISINNNIERMTEFVKLGRENPSAKMIFTGGSGDMLHPERKEAGDAKKFLQFMNFPLHRVTFEENSRNTHENAIFSRDIVKPREGEKWVLITSAAHMPRSMAVFFKAGWDVIPYPVDYETDLTYRFWPDLSGVSGNFLMLDRALKEIAGVVIYALTGKCTFPYPPAPIDSRA